MAEPPINRDTAYTAMCIWEEICSPVLSDAGTPWQEMRDQHGTATLRDLVLTQLAWRCDQAWTRAYAKYEADYRVWSQRQKEHEVRGEPFFDEAPDEPGAFDWEFVPFWLRTCVDWSDIHTGPRVRGIERNYHAET